jgi:hypothetical protein
MAMRTTAVVRAVAGCVILACWTVGCDEKIAEPETSLQLTGRVVLSGVERDSLGAEVRERLLTEVDGVPVYLESDSTVIATAYTTAGEFQFGGLSPGTYRAFSFVDSARIVATETLEISEAANEFDEVISLSGFGGVSVYRNPYVPHHTQAHYEFLTIGRDVRLTVNDPGINVVRTLIEGRQGPGHHSIPWDGLDDGGTPVPIGAYWVIWEVIPGYVSADLVFVDEEIPVLPHVLRFGWTISSSGTDPFANEDPPPEPGVITLYLWLACTWDEGASEAAFDLGGGYSILAFTPTNGFINATGPSDPILYAMECPYGPIVAAELLVYDTGAGGTICFEPSSYSGDCYTRGYMLPRDKWPIDYIGYSSDGTEPCSFFVEGSSLCGTNR